MRDITKKSRVNEELNKSEKKLLDVLDSTPFPVAVVDLNDENIIYWSQSATRLFGHTAPTTSAWYKLAYPDAEYRKEVINRWKAALEKTKILKEPVNTGEYNVTCKDGSVRICELYANFIKENIIVTFNDITEKKKVEEELLSSKEMLQRIIDLLPIRIFWKDKDLNYLGCNQVFAEDAGKKSPAEVVGKDDFQMAWKEQADLYRADDFSVIKSRKSKINYEEPQTTPEGKEMWLQTSKIPLIDKAGELRGVLGTYSDITEHKTAEDQIKERNREMEIFNKASTDRELRMMELKDKIKELEKRLEEKK